MTTKFKNDFLDLRIIGSGAFSTVFDVRSYKDGKRYAMKKVPVSHEELNKINCEVEILRKLQSKHVVRYYDSWIEDNYYRVSIDANHEQIACTDDNLNILEKPLLMHIQLELCSLSLFQFIDTMNNSSALTINNMDFSFICELLVQLLECVDYLHQQLPPIIHRDLKPENILISIEDIGFKVKLSDFGLSAYHQTVDQSHSKYVGTKSYRAPEVDTRYYDTKADIYSLGKIMLKMLNFNLISDTNEKEDELQSKYDKLKQICLNCISYSPSERPDCQQILNEKHLWNYRLKDSSYLLYSIFGEHFFDKSPIFCNINTELTSKIKQICIIEEYEDKVIFTANDKNAYSLRLSNHIDSSMQEPKLIKELMNEEINTIDCGYEHVLIVTKDMRVYSFGNNFAGQLGVQSYKSHNKPILINELLNERITDLSSGAHHSLALTECGRLYGWGNGSSGQLGNGQRDIEFTPTEIDSLDSEKIISISCGMMHSLALSQSGTVYGWGYNKYGQLGVRNNVDQDLPEPILFDDHISVKKIRCGNSHSLVLTNDNEIYSFGSNDCGELGIGNKIDQNSPIKIDSIIKFVDIECYFYENFSIALSTNNQYYVWGECGENSILSPTPTNYCSFHENFYHYSRNKFLFQTNITDKSIITLLNNNQMFLLNEKIYSDIVSLSFVRLKEKKVVLLTFDDMVYSIRLNESIDNSAEEPVLVRQLTNQKIKSIISGLNFVLCLTENYDVFSFGDNGCGQLGNGSRTECYEPTIMSELNNKHITEISCGHKHCLALSKSGKLFVWGKGLEGQIGNGETTDQLIPIELNSFNNTKIISISCGSNHCLALSSNGELYGWGDNTYGQLGLGNTTSQNKPILIDNHNEIIIKKIVCGRDHSLLLTNDNTIYGFGLNCFGQLGNGDTDDVMCDRMIKISTNVQFIDIHSNCCSNFSAGLSQSGKYYIWGKCGDELITIPKETEFISFNEIFVKYKPSRNIFIY